MHPQNQPLALTMPRFGVSSLVSRHGESFRMSVSRHPYHKLVFVSRGRGRLHLPDPADGSAEGDTVPLSAGDCVRVWPDQPHRFADEAGSPTTLHLLCVTAAAAAGPLGRFGLWPAFERAWLGPAAACSADDYQASLLLERFDRLMVELARADRETPEPAFAWAALIVQCLTQVARRQPPSELSPDTSSGVETLPGVGASLGAAVSYLDDYFTEPIRVDDLARRAGLSYRGFSHAFRKRTGQTVIDYVHRRRIELARQRLLTTGNIAGSAIDVGFNDLSHFYRVFKRYAGMTPRTFIEAQRLDDPS